VAVSDHCCHLGTFRGGRLTSSDAVDHHSSTVPFGGHHQWFLVPSVAGPAILCWMARSDGKSWAVPTILPLLPPSLPSLPYRRPLPPVPSGMSRATSPSSPFLPLSLHPYHWSCPPMPTISPVSPFSSPLPWCTSMCHLGHNSEWYVTTPLLRSYSPTTFTRHLDDTALYLPSWRSFLLARRWLTSSHDSVLVSGSCHYPAGPLCRYGARSLSNASQRDHPPAVPEERGGLSHDRQKCLAVTSSSYVRYFLPVSTNL
jgi:hypothetical protein